MDDAESGHEIARRGLDADRESFDAFSAKVSKITDKLRTLRTTLQMLERELDDIEDSAAKLESEVNPYVALKEEDDREQVRVDNRIGVAQDELDGLAARKSLVTFWVKGFKEVRLASIAEALTEFEVEVNSCLIELGMVGWEVKFDVDRETKSGGIAKGFSVRVVSPTGDRPTPLAAWSGGEGQRLRVAATMGLSNLIRSRMGIDLPIEVWDEPSAGLSQQGMQDLLQALEYRAVREGRVIWIVDHTAHSYGGFAGGALISKSASGSSIEQFLG